MNVKYLRKFLTLIAGVLLTSTLVIAEETVATHSVMGEIGWVDVQLGKLELNRETSSGTETTAYRITQNETRVTDSKDKQFLGISDLRAGQYITIDVVDNQKDTIVKNVVLESMPASEFQLAFGELKSLNSAAGTFVVEERVKIGQEERTRQSVFVYDPETIIVMHSPNKQHVELMLKPGDVIRVEYVVLGGKQQARTITLYSPTTTRTTTTTTTVTTR